MFSLLACCSWTEAAQRSQQQQALLVLCQGKTLVEALGRRSTGKQR